MLSVLKYSCQLVLGIISFLQEPFCQGMTLTVNTEPCLSKMSDSSEYENYESFRGSVNYNSSVHQHDNEFSSSPMCTLYTSCVFETRVPPSHCVNFFLSMVILEYLRVWKSRGGFGEVEK